MTSASQRLPWQQVDDENPLPGFEERVTHPEFAGIEFLHVRSKSIVNHLPKAANLPFKHTINVYRGCSHACTYCLHGDTRVLMADGRTKPLATVAVGDRVYGTERRGTYRYYVETTVLDHWSTVKPAYQIRLADGTELIASSDHRFLTSHRGWKYVTGSQCGHDRRPHLTTNNELMGLGGFSLPPKHEPGYKRGYLCGMIRGDATLSKYEYEREGRSHGDVYRFRLALTDDEPLERTRKFLAETGIQTGWFRFSEATAKHRALNAIRNYAQSAVEAIQKIVDWPASPTLAWSKGFLSGIFDAEGSYSQHVLRISNTDPEIITAICRAMDRLCFKYVVEEPPRTNHLRVIRLVGGLREQVRFFHTVDPATTRKRTFAGTALKSDAELGVEEIEPLGIEIPMFDITTGTGDFIADGVVSHNCFARPTHSYLELDPAEEFASVIVVKTNAVPLLRAELRKGSWPGEHVAMGTNTDPYQRCEGRYELTRGVVETLTEAGNPYSVLTKGTLALRDLDVFVEAQRRRPTPVNFSIPTLDEEVWRQTEPGTPHPRARIDAVAKLNDAGVPSGVMVAPVLPGISDSRQQLKEVVDAAVGAGAASISPITLHLRPGVREIFTGWLSEERPDLLDRYESTYTGSYAPKHVRGGIAATVRELIDEAGGLPDRPPRRARLTTEAEALDQSEQTEDEQLSLEL